MSIKAVLTGDIVNSTHLTATRERQVARTLTQLFADNKIDFYRGDSFQVYIKDPREALRLALLARTSAIRLFKDEKNVQSDIRISVGIGTVSGSVKSLRTARGQVFLLSGRQFDKIAKSNQRLTIISANTLANEGLGLIADYLNIIFGKMTGKQAEVIFELLKGEMQKTIARKTKKTKSTIHQRAVSGRWPEIENILQRYESIINQLI